VKDIFFTDRELDVMSVLWKEGSGTVAEVRERLQDKLGYTSVLKVLQILEEKGFVSHEAEGRAYRYTPLVQPAEAGGSALRKIVNKIFHGSTELLLARLVSDRDLTPEQLARMRKILDEGVEEAARGSRGRKPPTSAGTSGGEET
jgi:BlaI family transcriptional regulator, penicillinase repressor